MPRVGSNDLSRGNSIANRIHYRCSRMKIRLAQFQMNDRTALRLELFGAREYRQRAFAVQLRNA